MPRKRKQSPLSSAAAELSRKRWQGVSKAKRIAETEPARSALAELRATQTEEELRAATAPARAARAKLSAEVRSAIARKAAAARWRKAAGE